MDTIPSMPEPLPPRKAKAFQIKLNVIVLVLSVILYLVSCFMPALEFVHTDGTHDELMYGAQVLATGWLGIFMPNLAWFANPLYITSLVLLGFRKYKPSLFFAIAALLLAIQTFLLPGHQWLADEAGVKHFQLKAIHIGSYVWLLSVLVVIFAPFLYKELGEQMRP